VESKEVYVTNAEIIQLVIGSGGAVGFLIIIFKMGQVAQKIETMIVKMDEIKSDLKKEISDVKTELKKELSDGKTESKNDITEVKLDIKSINAKLGSMDTQMGKLEVRLEERTLRVHYDSNKEYAGADR
jgi:flagellar motility protein MotE (MotC chaperone)